MILVRIEPKGHVWKDAILTVEKYQAGRHLPLFEMTLKELIANTQASGERDFVLRIEDNKLILE